MIKKFFIQNKFCVILALLGAILLTLLTPHFYVKSEYWQNKLVLSEEAFVNLGFHQTTSDNLKNIINITKFSNIDKNVVINKLSDRFYEIKYKYHFILYPKTMQFDAISFYANSESEAVIEFPYNVNVKKFFKQNKFLIVWGVFGFIVGVFYVLKMLKGVNYLAMNNIFMSMDTKNVVRTICFGTARQYHS